MQAKFKSLVSYLIDHAQTNPNGLAYVFLSNNGTEEASITFAELEHRARTLAERIASHAAAGDRAILVFPPGIDFIVGFFACLYAGIIAVPMAQPQRDRLRDANIHIVKDCSPTLALTTSGFVESFQKAFRQVPGAEKITWFCTDAIEVSPIKKIAEYLPAPDAQTLAYLQYTSGSTSTPKGAMISHGNLIANLQMLTVEYGLGRDSTRVGWIPLYHDLGLALNALQACYVGALCVLMSPLAFVQRPLSWLKAIHEYKACFSAAPNFALDLCSKNYRPELMLEMDLSCLKWIMVGAEPVRVDTLNCFFETFAPFGLSYDALRPSYGMAETVLMVSGRSRNDGPTLRPVSINALRKNLAVPPENGEAEKTIVGCGMPPVGEMIAIVDPVSCFRLNAGQVGEIWVHGPHVAKGY